MHTFFNPDDDCSLFEFCARAPYVDDARAGEACFTFHLITQEMLHAKFLARFAICRIGYLAHGLALIAMLPLLWSALALGRVGSLAFPRSALSHRVSHSARQAIAAF